MKTITKLSIKNIVFISCISATFLTRGMEKRELQSASSASNGSSATSACAPVPSFAQASADRSGDKSPDGMYLACSVASSASSEEKQEERPLDCTGLLTETKALVLGYIDEWQEQTKLTDFMSDIWSMTYSPNGRYLLSRGSDDCGTKKVVIWDTKKRSCINTFDRLHCNDMEKVAYSFDGRYLASGSEDKFSGIKIWDTQNWSCVTTLYHRHSIRFSLVGNDDGVASMEYSPDGSYFVVGGQNGTIAVWSTKDWKRAATLEQSPRYFRWTDKRMYDPIEAVAHSRDSNYLAVTDNEDIKIWDTCNWHCVTTLTGHTSRVKSLAYSPDNRFLASYSWDETIRIWETESWSCVKTLAGSSVCSIAYSSDGNVLISRHYDEIIKIWNTKDWSCIATFSGKDRNIKTIACSPDGVCLASYASSDNKWEKTSNGYNQTRGTIRIWENQVIELSKPLPRQDLNNKKEDKSDKSEQSCGCAIS